MTLSLHQNQLDIWQTSLSMFASTEKLESLTALLTETELLTFNICKRPSERQLKILARAFLRTVLSNYGSLPAKEIEFDRSLHGKPSIANQELNIQFNLSHSNNLIVCAVSKSAAVGIDVEQIRFRKSLIKMQEKVFTEQECLDISSFSGIAQQRRFFDYWTLKESLVKATGEGLTAPLSSITYVVDKHQPAFNLTSYSNGQPNRQWRSWLWPLSSMHRLAVTRETLKSNEQVLIRSFCMAPNQNGLLNNTKLDTEPVAIG